MTAVQVKNSREQSGRHVTDVIVEKIADAEGVASEDLELCLYDVVEPDALNDLFQQQTDGPVTEGFVSFEFHGYRVTVRSDSSVEVGGTTP